MTDCVDLGTALFILGIVTGALCVGYAYIIRDVLRAIAR